MLVNRPNPLTLHRTTSINKHDTNQLHNHIDLTASDNILSVYEVVLYYVKNTDHL